MNNLKSKAGFTLVELIVVIAILAILAGVGTAAYTGYIKKAQEAADMQVLSSVNTAVQGLAAAESATVTSISVAADGTVSVITNPSGKVDSDDVAKLTGTLTFKDGFVSAAWSSTDSKWVVTRN